jgi:ABC-type uncharacterized transport system substrate-binding protein
MHLLFLSLRRVLLAGLVFLAGTALAHPVIVVSGDRSIAFMEAAESLTQELVRSGVARQDILQISTTEWVDGGPHTQDNRLVITLGSEAFRQLASHSIRTPLIAGLLPRITYERLMQESNRRNGSPTAALYLDQPFGRQLDLLRLALPSARRIGVLWGPESSSQQGLLNAALQGRGLELSEGTYSDSQALITPLRAALVDADVLLAVADGAVYNATTVSNILLTSYRAHTAVLAFSPAYVKAGALLSVHSSASQAGQQLASMASAVLQGVAQPVSQYPLDFNVTVNEYVARSLGLSLDARNLAERLHRLEKRP